MSAATTEHQRFTAAEYLARERASDIKHEFRDGLIVAMAGAQREHNLAVVNVVGELRSLLRVRPCEVYPSDMRVRIPAHRRYVYPDAIVVCEKPIFEDAEVDTLLNPEVIIEVLSESTEAYDRGDKFAMYRSLPSFREYVLVSTSRPRVERYQRDPDGTWRLASFELGVEMPLSCGVSIAIDEIYHKVPFPSLDGHGDAYVDDRRS